MRRGESLFEVMPEAQGLVDEGVVIEGSLLSGVSVLCWWEHPYLPAHFTNHSLEPELQQASPLEQVHLIFNLEGVQLWPLAIRYFL